jgi:hypothetical protein
MLDLVDRLSRVDARARELAVILSVPTGRTSTGHPYLQEPAWVRFRDWVPHILADGPLTLAAVDDVLNSAALPAEAGASLKDAARVVRQVVLTAAITAPPDLWLLRYVLASFGRLGLSQRLLTGEVVRADRCAPLRADELRVDLRFLLSRGLLFCAGEGFRMADHDAARAGFHWRPTLDKHLPSSIASAWAGVFARGSTTSQNERTALRELLESPLPPNVRSPGRFTPGPAQIELGFRLLPIVIGLRAAQRTADVLAAGRVEGPLLTDDDALGMALVRTLAMAGVVDDDGALGPVGRRVLERGIGPFGIVEAYHAYVRQLDDILARGRGAVWVERGANVAASQDANRHTFDLANDALDRFCQDTGFRYSVFIEHALGRGEATRQRSLRANARELRYVGADLEEAAIDAAIIERDAGRLPSSMVFVRHVDIGQPEVLIAALRKEGVDPSGAVMIVGNGFHEVRAQTDERMTAVLAGYASAGIVLLFTEETGLSVEDLLSTAWNTYHAGFKYVHERSGQGLRPAEHRASSPFDPVLPASWTECAERAGYVRLDAYSPRGRTVYPYTPASGQNPSISVTHFCVPAALLTARRPRA